MRLPENHSGARSDEHLVELWLSGRPEATQDSYRRDAHSLLEALPKGLPEATVADVVAWAKSLDGSSSYQARRVIAAKSLLTFAERTGYLVFNVGVALRIPKRKGTLHERILEVETVKKLITASAEGRDRILVKFLYASACRVGEAMNLNWADVGESVVTLHGKGGKTRTVPVSAEVLKEVRSLRWAKDYDRAPVFKSIRGRRLTVRDIQRIVKKARDEVTTRGVSPHWLRHAHATEAISKGCPLHVLSHSLGHTNVSTTSVYLHVKPSEGSSQWLNSKDMG